MSQSISPLKRLFKDKEQNAKNKDKLAKYLEKITEQTSNNCRLVDGINYVNFDECKEPVMSLEESEPYLSVYYKYEGDFIVREIKHEPILSKKSLRYTVFPILYKEIWDNYKTQQELNWSVNEIDLSKDVDDWTNKLSENDRIFIMYVLAFFASADGIVNANIKQNIIDHLTIKEAECAYSEQFRMENVHGEMYSLMIETFIKDQILKNKLINSIKTMPAMRKKVAWCERWIKSDKTIAHKMFAFSIVEGIFFSGSFASIFWLKTREGNLMEGLRASNTFIARDEAMHVQLTQLIFKEFTNRLKQEVVHEMIKEAVLIEDEFINEALRCNLIGMNSALMSQYIKYVSDTLLVQFDYEKLYNVENPFEFMNRIGVYLKDNFFERRATSYGNAIAKVKNFATDKEI
jgi:ribonucleoside-diphosphate reductase subunit M2